MVGRRRARLVGLIAVALTVLFSTAAYADRVGGGAGAGNDSVEVNAGRDKRPGGSRWPSGWSNRRPVPTTQPPSYDQCATVSAANPLYRACLNEFSVGSLQFVDQSGRATPQQVAEFAAVDYLKRAALPKPNPKMSAESGIAGAVHQLDLQIPSSMNISEPGTPFGDLRINATGRFIVDWGDGVVETYAVTGAPWPNSPISHTWVNRGNYTVVVTARWTASWSLGEHSGTVDGLVTTATIPDFAVGELQAMLR